MLSPRRLSYSSTTVGAGPLRDAEKMNFEHPLSTLVW